MVTRSRVALALAIGTLLLALVLPPHGGFLHAVEVVLLVTCVLALFVTKAS
jgi:hypothetical protein